MSNIWENNKKSIIICLIIVLCILIGVYIVVSPSSSNSIVQKEEVENKEIDKIVLFGQRTITLKEGENYVEPGYYAVTKDGEIKKDEVEVTGNEINGKESGTYYISYTIGNKKEERKIIIEEAEREEEKEQEGEVTLTLNGENMMILNIGSEYIEPGYKAIDTKEGDITNKVKVTGKVNTGKVGTYEIRYEVENSSSKKEVKIRQVVVKNDILKVNITGNSTNYTNQNVNLKIEVEGENFNYIKYPDGTVTKNKISNYEISKNGTYKFLIYDLENNYIKKEIVVDRIDKTSPTGSCTATIKDGQTKIVVNARDTISGIKNYVYYGDGKEINNQTGVTYTYNKQLSNAYVNIYDKASNYSKIICRLINSNSEIKTDIPSIKNDFLEMHFIVSGNNDDAILIRSGVSTILIDSGRYNCYKKIIPYLQDLGIKTIDAIIGSHPHYNHIQAQAKVIESFNVKKSYYSVNLNTCASIGYCDSKDVLYIKDAINKYNIPMNVIGPGDVVTIGDMKLYIIGPYKLNNTSKYKQNDNSLIFILEYKNNTFMFTGDADSNIFNYKQLKPYADKLNISLDVDMLKYPHHGNANLENNLLSAMSPKYVIVPNYNYTQFPKSSEKSKISKIGASVYQNGKDGNIVLISDGNNINVKTKQQASTYKR